MLRIAVPNKGSLAEDSIAILKEAGYRQRTDSRDLVLVDAENGVEFYYLRPRDIAIYVGSGELEAGITGRDLLIDSGAQATELMPLHFGTSTFRFAAPSDRTWTLSDINGLRVATAYPGLVEQHLLAKGIKADVVRLDGAVESSVRLGVADVIADVVSTGNTLRQAGLAIFGDPILTSEAIVISRTGSQIPAELEILIRRLQGVVTARQYVLLDYDIPTSDVDAACAITPGLESPTISPLQRKDWVAVRAMVLRKDTNRVMDELWAVGARGILVTDIHACRL
ncbi:MAG: ATP phosphoribosyltransferase [Actinobacteria bacterium]|uniref:ATP phosphoribosyltransferase n=1 Tax=freshwater metagenome TaxID=449393 RepID=A0A6J6W732_9ZZZZ|nr:ATP phosphoribosyltransferase [Actinomycetota bacterium]MSY35828.1 ATP phosphoribosyltransferase [Actinomycetota bacterium]MTA72243.1 ATP phosphoribosyltransferase [Actinomycetota bacterium]MTB29641.1 ATP phosphoribosyltransferase [Actinomycetota bacterium]MUH49003.1 ATP phosphoribosyltransferase [Actinomycetota bacterium]